MQLAFHFTARNCTSRTPENFWVVQVKPLARLFTVFTWLASKFTVVDIAFSLQKLHFDMACMLKSRVLDALMANGADGAPGGHALATRRFHHCRQDAGCGMQ